MCCVLPPSFQGNEAVADILNVFCLMPHRYAIMSVFPMNGGGGDGGGLFVGGVCEERIVFPFTYWDSWI